MDQSICACGTTKKALYGQRLHPDITEVRETSGKERKEQLT